ncbi:hypothetical protein AB0K34_10930 [Actinomadura sp. NPDC049382]|uniref:hypothetical protein n=1 Tax=Actinomadura sp. NPDC049382 TaxID=3158220 RepID=UPI0034148349
MNFPAQEAEQRDEAAARLAALKMNLDPRGVLSRLDGDTLAILDPATDQTVDTISVRPWPPAQDAPWFHDCLDTPVADANDVIGAAVDIIGSLQRLGVRLHG